MVKAENKNIKIVTLKNKILGAALVEYALLIALIAVVAIVALTKLGTQVSDKFNAVGNEIQAAGATPTP
ncbi:MAG TPA: Flp family type IVb pilin [Oligoflexia bacterium]|nr:Flp family type IVb pilin [Oligoflexia bacterium]HMP27481.1 Flp family type IVb pilin [Oligoflexia bacterium]